MSKIFFISDTHFGHKWLNTQVRKFTTSEECDDLIISNWNNVVSDEDTVYHLGDFSYKTSSGRLKYVMNNLKGKIHLIKGNHDGATLKINKNINRFETISEYLAIIYNNIEFKLFHYPIYFWHHVAKGAIHLYGHVHEKTLDYHPRAFNVSCENINYTPIEIEEILEKINNKINKL